MNTYTKLKNGDWGIRVIGSAQPQSKVTVQTKSGASKQETVDKILWMGTDKHSGKKISLCSIVRAGSTDSYGNRIRNGDSYRAGVTAPGGRKCNYCGSRECEGAWGGLCDQD